MLKLLLGLAFLVTLDRLDPVHNAVERLAASVRSGVNSTTGKAAADAGRHAAQALVRKRLARACRDYRALHGMAPADLEALVRGGFLQERDLVDEWGRRFEVEAREDGFSVRSAGADGVFDTADDWKLEA
jgi:hypothetical protein